MKTKGGNDANNLSRKLTPCQYPLTKKSLGDYPFLRQIVKGLRQDLRSTFFSFNFKFVQGKYGFLNDSSKVEIQTLSYKQNTE